MDPTLIIILAVPWLLIGLHHMATRGLTVLLLWLLIAPATVLLLRNADDVSLYRTEGKQSADYRKGAANITLKDALQPNRILLCGLLAIHLLNSAFRKKRTLPFDKTEKWMCAFSVMLIASVLLSSGRTAFGLRIAIDAFIVPFMSYYLARRFVSAENQFRYLTRVLGWMGIYVIFICLAERVANDGLFYRVQGPFEKRDLLYVAMAVVFVATLVDLVSKRDRYAEDPALPRSIAWFLLILAPVVILLTLTRGSWLGFLFGFSILLFLARRLITFSRQLLIASLVTISVPMIGLTVQSVIPTEFLDERVVDIPNVQGRFATWIAAVQKVGDAPLFGIGLNNLRSELETSKIQFGGFSNYTTPHNSFISLLAELGIVGLVVYLMMQFSMVKMGFNLYRRGRRLNDRWRGAAVVAIMASYHVPSMFEHLVYHPSVAHVYVYVFVGAIAGLYSGREPQRDCRSHIDAHLPLQNRHMATASLS